MRSSILCLPILAVLTLSLGCATSGGAGGAGGVVDTDSFPSRDELERVAARALPVVKADIRADVASWTLQGPLPNGFAHTPVAAGGAGGLNDVLLAHVPASSTSETLACAARELAAFYVQNGEQFPEPRLNSWILVRCGVTSGDLATHTLTWSEVPEKTKDVDVWGDADSRKTIGEMVQKKKGDAHVGIAFARNLKAGTAVVLVVGSGPRESEDALIDAASQVVAPESASVIVSGTVTQPAEVVYAYATKGLLDANECTLDLSVVLPKFRFTCPIDATDVQARIDVGVRRKGRVLGEQVANLLVVRDVVASSSYREATYGEASAGGVDLLTAINRVRATAGHAPLNPTAKQSEAVKKVAPHYFANLFADDRDAHISDVVALGLMAGWDVHEITIHDAGFATLLDSSGGGDDLLGYALDHPMPRAVLLDPRMTAAAIGPAELEGGLKGAIVVTYQALAPPDHAKAASEVFEKLRAVRKERGLGVTGSIPTEKIMLDAAQRIQAGSDIEAVARDALHASVEVMGRGFTIWRMEIHDVEHIAFPDELLTPKTTYVAISVATRKLPKSAWGSTVVLLLGFVEDTRVAVARVKE